MLLSNAVAILAAASWWWIGWPERTAREFIDRVTNGEDEAQWVEMVEPPNGPSSPIQRLIKTFPPQDWKSVEGQPRSLVDTTVGRSTYKITGEFGWEFVVQRGVVIPPSSNVELDVYKGAALAKEKERFYRERELDEAMRESQ